MLLLLSCPAPVALLASSMVVVLLALSEGTVLIIAAASAVDSTAVEVALVSPLLLVASVVERLTTDEAPLIDSNGVDCGVCCAVAVAVDCSAVLLSIK